MGSTPSVSSSSSSTWTGNSSFSTQLSAVINNAVTMASAPITQLQTQQTNLNNQQSELSTLSNDFQSLQSAIDSINSAAGIGSYSANVSNTSVASASVSSGVLAGSYSINVTNLGSTTNTMSVNGGGNGSTTVTDPTSQNLDSSSSYTLTVDGKAYNITGVSTLDGLAQAINTSGANVQATVVNVGGSSSPDYRLSVQSLNYAADTIQLSDNGSNTALLNTLSTGSAVTYSVNGQSSTVSSDSRTINLSTSLSVTLLGTGSTNITVSQNASGVASALSSFASAYNTAVDELAKNRGQNGGALSGQSVVYELQNALNSIANYSSGSAGGSLAALGLTFDQNGHLNFSSSTYYTLSASSPSTVLNFLGSETAGGFLQNAGNIMNSVTNSTTGILPQATQNVSNELTSLKTQITDDQNRVSQMQTDLTNQMAKADAAISSLESQVTETTSLFTDMQTYQYANSH